ncbi:MAG: hypothetical protein GY862_32935 [Gammaproteobacteria bacterium]|nr:hypothetical protein [Gammaproteobacteria bacterium]
MQTITLKIPDALMDSHEQNLDALMHNAWLGFVIWECVSGHLSLSASAKILNLPYRHFVDLLWAKGISIDGLDENELDAQVVQLRKLL